MVLRWFLALLISSTALANASDPFISHKFPNVPYEDKYDLTWYEFQCLEDKGRFANLSDLKPESDLACLANPNVIAGYRVIDQMIDQSSNASLLKLKAMLRARYHAISTRLNTAESSVGFFSALADMLEQNGHAVTKVDYK